jgi:hypothetical protein
MRTKQRFLEVLFSGWKTLAVEYHWFSGGFTMAQKLRQLRLILETFLGEEKSLCFMFGFPTVFSILLQINL